MKLQEIIETRRSCRRFTEYRVTDEEVNSILEAAGWAPSWKNFQEWGFIVVRDKTVIEKIAKTYSQGNPAMKCSLGASVLIVVCVKTNTAGFQNGIQETIHRSWELFDAGLAVQNACLKIHELGLGTVIVGLFDHKACKEILSVPEGYETVVCLPVGKPEQGKKNSPSRKALKEFCYLDAFGKPLY
jgi:nitroreductase